MSDICIVRELDEADMAYALVSMRESHHQSPGVKRMPWIYYKERYGKLFEKLISEGVTLGAYDPLDGGNLFGFLVMTPGKRVNTLHWTQVKFKDRAGTLLRRRGIMTEMLRAADLGSRFAYTLRGRKEKGKTLDEIIQAKLFERGTVATYIPLLEWLS